MAPTEPLSVPIVHRGLVSFAGLDADRTVVWLTGEHDLSTVAALSESLARAIALDDADLVVDLSGVEFLGAATLSVIIRAHAFLRMRSRSLALRSPSPSARRVIEACDLRDLLDPHHVGPPHGLGTVGALSTWVAVPSVDRAVRGVEPKTSPAVYRGSGERIPAISGEGP